MPNRTCELIASSLLLALAATTLPLLAQTASTRQLRNPSPGPPPEWLTKAEQTGFRQTPRYDETIAFCRRLAAASDWLSYESFGTSPEGRELPLVIASKDRAFTPEAARAAGKLVVFAQCCIHAGESAGKDASLMLLRDLAVTKTRAKLLDHVILLVVPILSTDGHERFSPYSRINQNGPDAMGWRTTSRNYNLNRDYVKADAVEMRAWLGLWNAWRPDLHFDHHTTDGGDWQYDVAYAADTHEAAAPEVAAWLTDNLYPQLFRAMEADGHLPIPYFWLVDSKDPSKGIRTGGFGPRYSTGYASVRNRPSILVETHMLKPYRTRVFAHYSIMLHTLEVLNRDAGSLRQAVLTADENAAKIGKEYDREREFPLAIGHTDESRPLTFHGCAYRRELSEVSGDVRIIYDNTEPIDIETTWYFGTEVTQTVSPPLAYIIPPQWTEVIALAKAHGLRCRRLVTPVTARFESYRFTDVTFPARSFEGRHQPRFATEPIIEERTFLPGSVVLPLDQPDAKLAIQMFEPAAPDSLVSWGFFNTIFERKEYGEHYVLEELARAMLESDPELRREFESKVGTDREFASNPRARLDFFYSRSPYWDDRLNVYPVARITQVLQMQTEPFP